jgi:hypothetical protein
LQVKTLTGLASTIRLLPSSRHRPDEAVTVAVCGAKAGGVGMADGGPAGAVVGTGGAPGRLTGDVGGDPVGRKPGVWDTAAATPAGGVGSVVSVAGAADPPPGVRACPWATIAMAETTAMRTTTAMPTVRARARDRAGGRAATRSMGSVTSVATQESFTIGRGPSIRPGPAAPAGSAREAGSEPARLSKSDTVGQFPLPVGITSRSMTGHPPYDAGGGTSGGGPPTPFRGTRGVSGVAGPVPAEVSPMWTYR